MTDIVEQLRNHRTSNRHGGCEDCYGSVMDDAADEVERLRDALKSALASLVATTSLIIRAEDVKCKPSKAVASDIMFRAMLEDYDRATVKARAALSCSCPLPKSNPPI